jgi:uncharacterized protein YggE
MRKATLLAASALFFATLTPAKGQTVPPPMLYGIDMPTVSINVTETEEAAPDIATISTGVQTTGKTAKEAMDLNTQKMAPLIAAIKANGIEAKDIQTTGLRLGADYDYTKAPRRLKGYSANNAVSVTIRDLSKLDKVMGALVGAGANELDGRGGFKDVRLLTVSEGVANSFPVPMARMAMMEAASAPADAPPIEQGEVSVSVTADFTFAMVK